jgi:hypothetical protein
MRGADTALFLSSPELSSGEGDRETVEGAPSVCRATRAIHLPRCAGEERSGAT